MRKSGSIFLRAEPLYVLYIAGKNVKIVRSRMREDFCIDLLLYLDKVYLVKYGNWKLLEI